MEYFLALSDKWKEDVSEKNIGDVKSEITNYSPSYLEGDYVTVSGYDRKPQPLLVIEALVQRGYIRRV